MNREIVNMSKGCPTHELPTELLETIFQHDLSNIIPSLHSINSHTIVGIYYQRMCQLSLVCRRWAALITGTSSFWTIISASMTQDFLDLCLERSSGQLIFIKSAAWEEADPFLPVYSQPSQQLFWDHVASYLKRCRAANTKCYDDEWKFVHTALTGPAPCLQSLVLQVGLPRSTWAWLTGQSGKDKPLFNLSEEKYPHLTRIGLKNIRVKGLSTLQGLASLDLNGVSGSEVSPIIMTGILRNCPDLHHLRLVEIYSTDPHPETEDRCVPMAFRHLRSLVIVSISLPIMSALFKTIECIPRCQQFELTCQIPAAVTGQYLNTTINHLLPDLRRIVQIDGLPIHLKFDNYGCDLLHRSSEESATSFSLHVAKPNSHRIAAVRFLASLMESTKIPVSLSVRDYGLVLNDGEDDDLELLGAVRVFPITELRLKNAEWRGWLAHLQSFYQLDNQAVFSRPFPDMTRLNIEVVQEGCVVPWDIPGDLMYSALDGRYSDADYSTKQTLSDWTSRGLEYYVPKKLEHFTFKPREPLSTTSAERLEEILGRGVFQYATTVT